MGTVDLSSTDSQVANLPTDRTFTAADAGSYTFTSVALKTAGSQTITATDSADDATTGTSVAVNVVPAAVKDFIVTTSFANPDGAGTAGTIIVTAKDEYGNTVGTGPNLYEGTVDLSGTDDKTTSLRPTMPSPPPTPGRTASKTSCSERPGARPSRPMIRSPAQSPAVSRSTSMAAAAQNLLVTTTSRPMTWQAPWAL